MSGNTQTVLGLYEGERLGEHWRLATEITRTGDELGVLLAGMLDLDASTGICLASTVPTLIREWERLADALGTGADPRRRARRQDRHPDQIRRPARGRSRPDRQRCRREGALGAPCIVVDFGTSTNFDVVSPAGEYVGGVLAPGDRDLDGRALRPRRAARQGRLRRAAERDREDDRRRAAVGLVYGFAGQVDGIVERIRGELEAPAAPVVATGGLAELVAPHSQAIASVDPFLTLDGLRMVWELNR